MRRRAETGQCEDVFENVTVDRQKVRANTAGPFDVDAALGLGKTQVVARMIVPLAALWNSGADLIYVGKRQATGPKARYDRCSNAIFSRSPASAFLAALGVLTAVIWLTQAMKDFDLMTTKGQSLIVFFHVTGLIIPSLVMVISPIAAVHRHAFFAQQA